MEAIKHRALTTGLLAVSLLSGCAGPKTWTELDRQVTELTSSSNPALASQTLLARQKEGYYTGFSACRITAPGAGPGAPTPAFVMLCAPGDVGRVLESLTVQATPGQGRARLTVRGNLLYSRGDFERTAPEGWAYLAPIANDLFRTMRGGAGAPFPVESSVLVIEKDPITDGQVVIRIWHADLNWAAAQEAAARTDCWALSNTASIEANLGVDPELTGKRGCIVTLAVGAAPGGCIYYGLRNRSTTLVPPNGPNFLNDRYLQWGHGVVIPSNEWSNREVTGAALAANGIAVKGRLLGTQTLDLKADEPVKLRLDTGDNAGLAKLVAEQRPPPGK